MNLDGHGAVDATLPDYARLAGAPMDKGGGVDLLKKMGDSVRQGEPLCRIHADFPADFNFAVELAGKDMGFSVGESPSQPHLGPLY